MSIDVSTFNFVLFDFYFTHVMLLYYVLQVSAGLNFADTSTDFHL